MNEPQQTTRIPEAESIHQCEHCKKSVLFGDTALSVDLAIICDECNDKEREAMNEEAGSEMLAFAVQAKLTNGAIGEGIIFAISEEMAKSGAASDPMCSDIIRIRRVEAYDMYRGTFQSGKVYRQQAFCG